ncbi:MAG: RDD family protein [Ferruginibacter sp.]
MGTTETSTDLLVGETPQLVRADTGKRFLNYIIDAIAFYILVFLVSIVIALLAPDLLQSYVEDDRPAGFSLLDNIISLVLYAVYMGILEAVTKGKSLGKLITGTRAVNLDGSKISAATAFGRGFSRAVPFAAFSALGTPCNPWQDKWTNTMVIDEKQTRLQSSYN